MILKPYSGRRIIVPNAGKITESRRKQMSNRSRNRWIIRKGVWMAPLVFAIVLMMAVPVMMASNVSAKLPNMDGARIVIVTNNPQTIPSDGATFIKTGIGDLWLKLTPDQKKVFFDDELTYIKVYMDDVEVHLREQIQFYKSYQGFDENGNPVIYSQLMIKWYYIEFEPGHFDSGSIHTFHTYYWELKGTSAELSNEWTTIVTFT